MGTKVDKTEYLRRWVLTESVDLAVRNQMTRGLLLRLGKEKSRRFFADNSIHGMPERVREMRHLGITNLLTSLADAVTDGRISPRMRRGLVKNFVGQIVTGVEERNRPFAKQYGVDPPTMVAISPTQLCNLKCVGCYAASSNDTMTTLPFDVFQRILDDKRENWGSHFTVIVGGEPLVYRSQGKKIFDIFERNNQDYHMMYTNGTLITRDVARRLADLGNVSPAISVEGGEKETDARRGKGVYRKILASMEHLRAEGVPFGVSITAMRHNAELVMSREFIDFWFKDQGAIYGWVFQYMPIGRSATIANMVTPEQRLLMAKRQIEMIYDDGLFLVDFWNGGALSEGCIAAGRPGGYLHINWHGDVMPCAFFPYAVSNVKDLYDKGESLTSALQTDFFQAIYKWQNGYLGRHRRSKNLFAPCPIRDHHKAARGIIKRYQAKPTDESAAEALADPEYEKQMLAIGDRVNKLLDPLWEGDGNNGRGVLCKRACSRSERPAERHRDLEAVLVGDEEQN